MTIIAATGHRPNKLGGYGQHVRSRLTNLAIEHLRNKQPEKVISGMSLGWDQAWAVGAITLGIPFIAAVPFEGQESMWPEESRVRYHRILERAAEVVVIASSFSSRAMQQRNAWMVDHADEIAALWNGMIGGGTANCIAYVTKREKPWANLWDRWTGESRNS